jgi:hypothetical protein
MMTMRSEPSKNTSAFSAVQYDRSLLHSDIPQHLHQLRVSTKAIYESPLIDEQGSFALPIECDDVMEYLESIDQTMSKIREAIKAVHHRKETALPSPYKLLMYLYAADDHVHSAMRSVQEYRPICARKTSKSKQSQSKVQGELWTLVETCEKIENEAGNMLDELLLRSY